MNKLKIKVTHLLIGAGVVLGGLTGYVVNELTPYCPEEDSCWVDYDGARNRWVVHEGQSPR